MIHNDTDYLYHYTSIENLALILKNRTIRLNALSNMDDRQESRSADLYSIGRFFFVSCWTDEEKESIPMWNMYTRIDSGVRIGLQKNPFVSKGTSRDNLSNALNMPGSGVEKVNTFLDLSILVQQGVFSPQAWEGDILIKILYTDDKCHLEPQVVTIDGDQIQLDYRDIGKYKNTYWSFQNEWRYLIVFLPLELDGNMEMMQQKINVTANLMARDMLTAPFDYYDLQIREDAMEAMVVTPSPKITPGNRMLLDLLLEKYNPKALVRESELNRLV